MIIDDTTLENQYYDALVAKDKTFVGIFIVGVKTTSVCCIASCTARKPKRENVSFFTTLKSALAAGYRPCKICKPTQNAFEAPKTVSQAIELVKTNPKSKISDQILRDHDIAPEMVRRWFNKNYGITFQAYQRMYRINNAYLESRTRKKTSDVAYDNGFESLSGFNYTYKKLIGQSPKSKITRKPILIDRFTTPLGPMFVCATELGICLLEFVDRRMLETEFKDLQRLYKCRILVGENKLIKQAKKEVTEYFNGVRQEFDVALDPVGTEFQQKVWQALQKIPFGTTATYQTISNNIQNSKAVRAVGTANGANRISIMIPCHRIIGSNGKLTGYGGGIARKKWLLQHEAAAK